MAGTVPCHVCGNYECRDPSHAAVPRVVYTAPTAPPNQAFYVDPSTGDYEALDKELRPSSVPPPFRSLFPQDKPADHAMPVQPQVIHPDGEFPIRTLTNGLETRVGVRPDGTTPEEEEEAKISKPRRSGAPIGRGRMGKLFALQYQRIKALMQRETVEDTTNGGRSNNPDRAGSDPRIRAELQLITQMFKAINDVEQGERMTTARTMEVVMGKPDVNISIGSAEQEIDGQDAQGNPGAVRFRAVMAQIEKIARERKTRVQGAALEQPKPPVPTTQPEPVDVPSPSPAVPAPAVQAPVKPAAVGTILGYDPAGFPIYSRPDADPVPTGLPDGGGKKARRSRAR